jgi:hypothetical protein
LRIEARFGVEDFQFRATRAWVLPSVNVPMRVSWNAVPLAIVTDEGVTAMETRLTEITLSEVEPVTAPVVAVIVEAPIAAALARPVLETVATEASDELHTTAGVKS